MIFTAAIQLLFPTTSPTTETGLRVEGASHSAWTMEARGENVVFSLPQDLEMDAPRLAALASDIEEMRAEGFEAALACKPGPALESLRKVHFHRFVDILPNRVAARRWAFGSPFATAHQAA